MRSHDFFRTGFAWVGLRERDLAIKWTTFAALSKGNLLEKIVLEQALGAEKVSQQTFLCGLSSSEPHREVRRLPNAANRRNHR